MEYGLLEFDRRSIKLNCYPMHWEDLYAINLCNISVTNIILFENSNFYFYFYDRYYDKLFYDVLGIT